MHSQTLCGALGAEDFGSASGACDSPTARIKPSLHQDWLRERAARELDRALTESVIAVRVALEAVHRRPFDRRLVNHAHCKMVLSRAERRLSQNRRGLPDVIAARFSAAVDELRGAIQRLMDPWPTPVEPSALERLAGVVDAVRLLVASWRAPARPLTVPALAIGDDPVGDADAAAADRLTAELLSALGANFGLRAGSPSECAESVGGPEPMLHRA